MNPEGFRPNRREFGKLAGMSALTAAVGLWPRLSLAANPTGKPLHGLSAFGDLKYAPDYKHFDWVNPQAPKGGTFNFSPGYWYYNQNVQTFDTLNSFVLKGSAPPRMELCFDTLMVVSDATAPGPIDVPSEAYGRLAETVTISEDRNTYTFKLRPEARFHDGSPLTSKDVAFTYELLKKDGHPQISLPLGTLSEAVATDERTVELRFNGEQSDQAILDIVSYPVLSAAWYADRDFSTTTMEAPLGSGPYKVGQVNAGTFIEYDRVDDYWAKDMPFAIGMHNFDRLRIEFYRERQAAFEAFKKGTILWRQEFTSKTWATEYDFPAKQEGKVRQTLFDSEKRPSMQAWALNMRREKFSDPRTRQAIGLCFDFEWTNENLFFGSYTRSHSLFEKSEFKAEGKPSDAELALLEPFRGEIPDSAFGEAVMQPVSDGSGRDRKMLREASRLFAEAGWKRDGNRLIGSDGQPLIIVFLIRSPTFERILGKFVANLKAVGVDAAIRLVDPSQFQARIDSYDFDIFGMAFSFGATPTAEGMEQFFSSKSAGINGAKNYPGLKLPALDALIEKIRKATSRDELIVAMRALDRVLRSTHSWIPNWYSANHRVAHWDMFGYPETKPDYAFPVETFWWYDEAKAKAIGKG